MTAFKIERLAKHSRSEFDCGIDVLNSYLVSRASQEMRRRFCVCYVIIETSSNKVAGFYTLSASSVSVTELPSEISRRLPRYPSVPVARIGRLAIDIRYRSRGLGGVLLFDAIKRASEADIASYAMLVDAKDDDAARFYEHFGFQRFTSQQSILFLPIDDALRNASITEG